MQQAGILLARETEALVWAGSELDWYRRKRSLYFGRCCLSVSPSTIRQAQPDGLPLVASLEESERNLRLSRKLEGPASGETQDSINWCNLFGERFSSMQEQGKRGPLLPVPEVLVNDGCSGRREEERRGSQKFCSSGRAGSCFLGWGAPEPIQKTAPESGGEAHRCPEGSAGRGRCVLPTPCPRAPSGVRRAAAQCAPGFPLGSVQCPLVLQGTAVSLSSWGSQVQRVPRSSLLPEPKWPGTQFVR
ncbi:PREDICTED: uncharacterized protein LOC105585751 [Cercocebus atys]|uniref:uncharacterized protein LOC105585751 n=1 Tax=Cercocebus atys TaxID=9531 RepID=UPI0005F42FC5|nr:PREDICTED: uncharacterized protein LOC105585751 [Cercocebus atys]